MPPGVWLISCCRRRSGTGETKELSAHGMAKTRKHRKVEAGSEPMEPLMPESGEAPTSPSAVGTSLDAGVVGAASVDAAPTPAVLECPLGDWELLKKEGTELYMSDDFPGAIEKYGAAIKSLEALKGDEPELLDDRKVLAILYTNRAMASLQIIRRAMAGKKWTPGATLEADLRKMAMRANVDASNAVELDEGNAKAWLRKGQALLWMSAMQQRAKEAMVSLERARDSANLPASMKKEVQQWHKYATTLFNNHTDMPENCPQM